MTTDAWEKKLDTESTHTVVSKILGNANKLDEASSKEIIKRLILYLDKRLYKWSKSVDQDSKLNDLKVIGNVLDRFLESVFLDRKDCSIPLIFVNNLARKVSEILKIVGVNRFEFDVAKIGYIMQLLEMYDKIVRKRITAVQIKSICHQIKNTFILHLSKKPYEVVIDFCAFGLRYWKLLSKILVADSEEAKRLRSSSNKFVILLLMPQFVLMIKLVLARKRSLYEEELDRNEARDVLTQKVVKMLCPDDVRVGYMWRDALYPRPDIFELATRTLGLLKDLRAYFTREQGVVVFQNLIYLLDDVNASMKMCRQNIDSFKDQVDFFRLTFNTLTVLIEDFQITWRDGEEAMDVLAVCLDFLSCAGWSSGTVVDAFKVVNVAITKYMAPNMVLLVDTASDSTIYLLGPLLRAKLCHEVEVRKVVLDVICTVAGLSKRKFPSLQKVLMDSELPTLVVKMSTHDGESFVRATAIKCLQEMIQVEDIWNNALKTEDLPQKMSDILLNETEGIVRVEAATFMCVAYKHQQFPKNTLNKIYETMIYASTVDLHWEVKVRSLDFWDKVIKNHLQNQGMIDGSFPNVTFSKEHRKIVTLTDSEIKKRLLKVLGQLSAIGCLGVLVSAIKDDCDMEVSKTGAKITEPLVDLFKKYNVTSDSSTPTSPMPTETGTSCAASVSSGISVDESMTTDSPAFIQHDLHDEVIDQIVNSNDSALLRNVYTSSDYGSVNNYDIQVRKIVSPNQFLEFTQQDLSGIINEKKNWLNGIEDLGSLLDDMLKTYENDINSMDCY